MSDTANIRAKLEGLNDLTIAVRAWRVEAGLDTTDDPAMWIWVLIEPSNSDAGTLRHLKWIARDVVREATGLWAYVLVRGADEAEAAA